MDAKLRITSGPGTDDKCSTLQNFRREVGPAAILPHGPNELTTSEST
jgi:hypothetical protein